MTKARWSAGAIIAGFIVAFGFAFYSDHKKATRVKTPLEALELSYQYVDVDGHCILLMTGNDRRFRTTVRVEPHYCSGDNDRVVLND